MNLCEPHQPKQCKKTETVVSNVSLLSRFNVQERPQNCASNDASFLINSVVDQITYRVGEGEDFLTFMLFSGAISTGFTGFTGGVGGKPRVAIAASRATLAAVTAIF